MTQLKNPRPKKHCEICGRDIDLTQFRVHQSKHKGERRKEPVSVFSKDELAVLWCALNLNQPDLAGVALTVIEKRIGTAALAKWNELHANPDEIEVALRLLNAGRGPHVDYPSADPNDVAKLFRALGAKP